MKKFRKKYAHHNIAYFIGFVLNLQTGLSFLNLSFLFVKTT